jgi:hypothetical protein
MRDKGRRDICWQEILNKLHEKEEKQNQHRLALELPKTLSRIEQQMEYNQQRRNEWEKTVRLLNLMNVIKVIINERKRNTFSK